MGETDLISRQAAIDAILNNQEVYSNNFGDDPIDKYTVTIIDNDAQTIAQLPSVHHEVDCQKCVFCGFSGFKQFREEKSEQRWIPMSERPPKESGKYYVSGGGKVWICEYIIIPNFIGGWCNDSENPVVKAWMLPPEPYKDKQ